MIRFFQNLFSLTSYIFHDGKNLPSTINIPSPNTFLEFHILENLNDCETNEISSRLMVFLSLTQPLRRCFWSLDRTVVRLSCTKARMSIISIELS